MLMNRVLLWMTRISLARRLAAAVLLFRLIADAMENKKVSDVARYVFKQLPAEWRHPEGPATETEFVELIQTGQLFLTRIQAVLKKA